MLQSYTLNYLYSIIVNLKFIPSLTPFRNLLISQIKSRALQIALEINQPERIPLSVWVTIVDTKFNRYSLPKNRESKKT